MTRRKKNTKGRPSRLDRIERKCDIILSELLLMRQRTSRESVLDEAIERLHRSARDMRKRCQVERDAARVMFDSTRKE